MLFNGSIITVRAAIASLFAAAAISGASPAYANSSANADIAAPLRAAQAAKPASGGTEEQFKKLFANWQAIEKQQAPLAAVSQAADLAASSRSAPSAGFASPFRGSNRVSIPRGLRSMASTSAATTACAPIRSAVAVARTRASIWPRRSARRSMPRPTAR